MNSRRMRTAFIIFAAGVLLALMSFAREYTADTIRRGYILRGSYGEDPVTEYASASTEGHTYDVEIPVPSKMYTKEEAAAVLADAEKELKESLFRDISANHIEQDLPLPESLRDGLIRVSWNSSRPEILSPDGFLGNDISSSGTPVTLTAVLSLMNEERPVTFDLTVYPKALSEEERFLSLFRRYTAQEDPSSDRLYLPDTLDGQSVLWKGKRSATPLYLLLLGLLGSVLSVFAAASREAESKKKREEALLADYPSLAMKLSLLLRAGLSSRLAIRRIALDYAGRRDAGCPSRPGYEAFAAMYYEMNRGTAEIDAYRNLGRRCPYPAYRTLSATLAQNLTKGSRTLLEVLDKEAENAREERRKKARILGETASIKLLAPMLAHLAVVLVIMIVPAFMTIF